MNKYKIKHITEKIVYRWEDDGFCVLSFYSLAQIFPKALHFD